MSQLRLFEDSCHLEPCFDDPPISAFEHTYYTPYYILYPAVRDAVAEVIELRPYIPDIAA